LARRAGNYGGKMEIDRELQTQEILEFQKMLDTPIEDQAADYELSWLGMILKNGIAALQGAEGEEERYEALGLIIKSAFVIGRRHTSRLI
jgi:hypothetical protein